MVEVLIIRGTLPSNRKETDLICFFFVLLFLIVCYYLCKQKKDSCGNGSAPLFLPNPRDSTRDNQSETRQQYGIDMAEPREITRHKHRNPDANHRNPHQPIKKSLRSIHLQDFRFFLPITFVFSTQKFIFYSKKARFFSRKPSKTAKKTDFRCKIKKKIWSVEKNVVILHRFFKNHIIN